MAKTNLEKRMAELEREVAELRGKIESPAPSHGGSG